MEAVVEDGTVPAGSHLSASLVEGVGDEVLLSSTIMLVLLSSIVVLFRGWYVSREEDADAEDPQTEGIELTGSQGGGDGSTHVTERRQRSNQQQQQELGEGLQEREPASRPRRPSAEHVTTSDGSVCAICLDSFTLPIETNCGHIFCAGCLLSYRNYGNTLRIMQCPMCRQTVTLLFECFTTTSGVADGTVSSFRSEIRGYNRRFSAATTGWLDYLRDIPTLFRHLWREFFSVGGLVLMFRLRVLMCVVAALIYLLSPLDIIPELFLGLFGLLDDAFIVILLLMYVTAIYRRYVANRQ